MQVSMLLFFGAQLWIIAHLLSIGANSTIYLMIGIVYLIFSMFYYYKEEKDDVEKPSYRFNLYVEPTVIDVTYTQPTIETSIATELPTKQPFDYKSSGQAETVRSPRTRKSKNV